MSAQYRHPDSVLYDVHTALENRGCKPKPIIGDKFTSRCPAHDDSTPSLSVTTGDKGVILHCFANCDPKSILDAIGFDYTDLFYETTKPADPILPSVIHTTPGIAPLTTQRIDQTLRDRLASDTDYLAQVEHERGIKIDLLLSMGCGLTTDHQRLVIPTYDRDGELAPREWIALAEHRGPKKPKMRGPRGAQPDLFPRPETPRYADGSSILIVEGEPDALLAYSHNIQVTGLPGVNTWQAADAERFARFDTVTILLDDDEKGREASAKIARDLRRAGIRTIERHHTTGAPTTRDLVDLARETDNLKHAINQLRIVEPATLYNQALVAINIDQMLDTEPEPRQWVWDDYFCVGTLNMLHGAAGLGKSMLALRFAAALTEHGIPDLLNHPIQPHPVSIIDAENSLDEIHRRLRVAGIDDRTKIRYYRTDITILGLEDTITLFEEISKHSRVVILDSMRGLWDGDEKEQAEAGRMLRTLARIAEQTGLCIILIHHDTKAGQYSGSSDIDAAISGSRLHIQRAGDPKKKPTEDDDEWLERILSHAKCRIGAEQRPIRFKISITEQIYLHISTGSTSDLEAAARELYEWAAKHPAWPNVPVEDVKDRAGIDDRNDWRKLGNHLRNGKWAKPYNGANSRVIEFIVDAETSLV